MERTESRSRAVRWAALALTLALVAFVAFTYLAYTGSFTSVDTVTVSSERAGLVMERDAKVKYLGVQVGKVAEIRYDGAEAELTLQIRRDQMGYLPSNVDVRIASNTVFGAKSVEFLPPATPSSTTLAPDAHLRASAVAVEVNTLFQSLVDTLHKINPVQLNATLTAVGDGLRDNGNSVGQTISGLTDYLGKLNPHLPTLQSDFQKTATTADIYAAAAPDLVTIFDNTPTISNTIVDEQTALNKTLMAAAGLADNTSDVLEPAENDLVAAIQRLRAPLKVLGDYSPEFGCVFSALASALQKFGPSFGGTVPGLFVSVGFLPGAPAYTYPESLPYVNASGGPNCRGLPDLPTKQGNGSWYKAPFLVTDNAYVPFQPLTELQFDAPSTLQFLFHGAYAERDDY
jgi:phospholipid/cholesterol/gamma-HCH transport system substrate-binding protein